MNLKYFIKGLKILGEIFIILIISIAVIVFCTSCQVKRDEGELLECYYMRACIHEGKTDCSKLVSSCDKILRADRCESKTLAEKSVYKDFDDCWKTLD